MASKTLLFLLLVLVVDNVTAKMSLMKKEACSKMPSTYSGLYFVDDVVKLHGCYHEVAKRQVILNWSTGLYPVHELWLLDNRADWRHATGQKIKHADPYGASKLVNLSCDTSGLRVSWSDAQAKVLYPTDFLERWAMPDNTLSRQPPSMDKVSWEDNTEHDFFKVVTSDKGLLEFMQQLHDYGVAMISNVPGNSASVGKIADRMGGKLETLYGSQFSVSTNVKSGPKKNIAYTDVEIELHQDCVYYESIPGFQLLHALKFDDSIKGGGSLILDSFLAAEELRRNEPVHFQTLTKIPATFVKLDMDREKPAQFDYRTPHIHTHPETGEVIKVVWSPPFEGPLVAPIQKVEAYYKAKEAFKLAMQTVSQTHLLEFALKEGQLLAFNNNRMLHGRRAFKQSHGAGERNLQGAYVDGDVMRNQLQVMRMLVNGESLPAHRMVHQGNRCL